MRCLQNQCQSKKILCENWDVCQAPQGVHYFMLLTDDKHLVGKGANAMIGKLQRIHNFTLFAASQSPAPRQSVVDDRAPQIMDWDVGSKDFERLPCKAWKWESVIGSSVGKWAHLSITTPERKIRLRTVKSLGNCPALVCSVLEHVSRYTFTKRFSAHIHCHTF